jgi:hypothetical protein
MDCSFSFRSGLRLGGFLAAVVFGAACGKLTTFTVPAEKDVEVPGVPVLGANPLTADEVFPGGLLSEALSQALTESFDTQGYDKDAVESLQLTKLAMTVARPEENGRAVRGLGFIERITVSIGGEGVDAVVVADSEDGAFDGAPGPAAYDMPVTREELAPAFQAGDALDMTADVAPSEPPNVNTTVTFRTELTVQVNVFGVLNGS